MAALETIVKRGDPFTVKHLKANGRDVMDTLGVSGRDVGRVLDALLDKVLEDPALNERETLTRLMREI
jgi:tRNA nucleotidyltransferase (CCA-adding enzyme)